LLPKEFIEFFKTFVQSESKIINFLTSTASVF